MRGLCFLLIVIALPVVVASAFETDSWPGEGIPVFSSKVSQLKLHVKPSQSSSLKTLKYKFGWKVVYDKSKVITHKSVPLVSKVPVHDIWCDGERINIEAGEQVEYMQYRAEGFGTVIIHDKVCEVYLESGNFQGLDQEPETEWWIRVIDKDKKPEGWLLVSDEQLNFLRRQF